MSSTTRVHDRCANLVCPNRPGEGAFALVTTDAPIVGGHRPLALFLCGPCAVALRDWKASA